MIHSLKDDNQGVAFVAVMMAMLVLSILSVAALSMTTSNLKNGLEEREFQSTYYIAEGGADYYTEDLKGEILEAYIDADTADEFFAAIESSRLDVTVNESSALYDRQYNIQPEVDMTLKADGTYGSGSTTRTYIIESTGTLDAKERTVVKPITIEWIDKSPWKTDYAVLTYGDLELTGSTEISGPVYSMGDIILNGDIEIDGDVFAEGDVKFVSSADVTGDVYSSGDVTIENSGTTIGGDVYSSGIIKSKGKILGDVHAPGDVILYGNSAKVGGNVYSEGKISLDGRIEGNAYAFEEIVIENWHLKINGSAYTKKTITNAQGQPVEQNVDGTIWQELTNIELPEYPDFPEVPKPEGEVYPDFPVFPEKEECLQLTSKYYSASDGELVLTGARTYIPKIDVHNTDLTIKYSDKQVLMVDEFKVHGSGKVKLEGEGSLRLYVNKKLELASCPLNYTDSTDNEEIQKTREKIEVYAKGNDVKISGGGANLLTKILYAPEAYINLSGDGNVQGPVIANKVKIEGSELSNVRFNPDGDAPDGEETPPDPDDLIIISPVREK